MHQAARYLLTLPGMATHVHYEPQQQAVAAPGSGRTLHNPVGYTQQPTQQGANTVASQYSVALGPAPAYYPPQQQGAIQLVSYIGITKALLG